MEDVKRILVVSSMTKSSRKAIHYGVSLSKKIWYRALCSSCGLSPLRFRYCGMEFAFTIPGRRIQKDY
jgi:hypothetical protein